jgi:hypothetical protein
MEAILRDITMKSSIAVILASAVAGILSAGSVFGAEPAPAGGGDTQANIPVREVVLFSSGVGYFEHFGQVKDNSATVLHFKTEQINDILKSLVLQDLDKGVVNAVTYPSQGPLERTLKSFQLDLTSNPNLADLLNQLRGAKVSVTMSLGARSVEGTVLGVEKQQRPTGDKDHLMQDVSVLNLVQDGGIVPIELAQISDVKIQDPELRKELTAALAAVAQARDKDKKPVEIHFTGQGERRVRLGYVVETPVWKTSYRLLLPGAGEGPAAPQPSGASEQKGKETDFKQGQAKAEHLSASIQGWAIVENQTDSDWKDVQLSLVSGRPISFIEDLYQPLYIPRPTVRPELYASLSPQTYSGGLNADKEAGAMQLADRDAAPAAPMAAAPPMAMARQRMMAQQMQSYQMANRSMSNAAKGAFGGGPGGAAGGELEEALRKSIDPSSSVSSIASAAKVGELFQYTVGNVSIGRQQSAMLPIVTDTVQVDKVSIYNQSVLPNNPLLGARLKNTTGKYLMQGPITVLSGGSYAGDANIQDLPTGQERLISYGVDQEVTVHASDNTQNSQLLTGKIVKGVLELTYKQTFSQEYKAEDKGQTPKSLVIEAPRHIGWTLVEPAKALETTDTLYRFEGKLKPQEVSKLTVKEEHTDSQQMMILPMDVDAINVYVRTGEIPQPVRDALAKAAQLHGAVNDTQRQLETNQQKINDISAEQSRIRENMKAVNPASDYYKRLLTELDEQETTIQDLHKQVNSLQKQLEQQQKDLEAYLATLSVG